MRWIALFLGVLAGVVTAAYLSLAFELDRAVRDDGRSGADRPASPNGRH